MYDVCSSPGLWRGHSIVRTRQRPTATYILDTFLIVRHRNKAASGNYRTKTITLAYHNALAAGDTTTDAAV